jgi:hypothetical protein
MAELYEQAARVWDAVATMRLLEEMSELASGNLQEAARAAADSIVAMTQSGRCRLLALLTRRIAALGRLQELQP